MFKTLRSLRFPPIVNVRIVTGGIVEDLTQHDNVKTSATWQIITGRRKLKIV